MAVGEAGQWILDDAEVVWNSVDLSDHTRRIGTDLSVEEREISAMGDTWKEWLMGVPSGTIQWELYQDYYTSEVDATLRADFTGRTKRTMTIMPDKTSGISTTNPQATFSAYITNYPWLDGTFNETLMVTVTIRITGAVTFSTS